MSTVSPAVGIDLGTTYSCVGVWLQKHDRVEIIANDQGHRITPSCVSFSDSERLVEDAAFNDAAMNPKNTIYGKKCAGLQASHMITGMGLYTTIKVMARHNTVIILSVKRLIG